MDKINIAALSDTHNQHNKIKDIGQGDLIIHAGDFSSRGHKWESENFIKWYSKVPYTAKILICGNHEVEIERTYDYRFKQMCKEAGIILLEDSTVELQFIPGIVYVNQNIPDIPIVRIHGSPVTPWFYGQNWGWNRARNNNEAALYNAQLIKPHWDMIPDNTDILVTHGPPYDILDEVLAVDGQSYKAHGMLPRYVGCEDLLKRVKEVKPDLHIFGHIHCSHGEKHVDGTSHYNVSMCGEMNMIEHEVTRIEYALDETV